MSENLTTSSIEEILESLGYSLTRDKDGWRTRPLYRDSNNDTSLKIYDSGFFCDFSAGIKGSFEELIRITKGLDTIDKAKEYLKNNNLSFVPKTQEIGEPLIKMSKTFDANLINELKQDYSYWNGRGISDETLKKNEGGIQGNRYWFIIRNSKGEIVGKTGRDLTGKSKVKWLHKGLKNNWVYNAYLNNKIIQEKKQIYIVESPGDYLSMFECGIKNVLVIFGVEMSLNILNYLLRVNPDKIILSLNNDFDNGFVGNDASVKLEKRLRKYFDRDQISCILPKKYNDWNDVLTKEGKQSILEQLQEK